MAWTLYLLAQHPEVQATLEAEIRNALCMAASPKPGLQLLPYTR